VGSMRRDQAQNGAFRQVVGIDSVEECIDVLGIGRQAGKRSILLARIPRNGGRGIFFDCGIMTAQQGEELLSPRFAICLALTRTCLSAASRSTGSFAVLNNTTC
jgi:hypothetical protein